MVADVGGVARARDLNCPSNSLPLWLLLLLPDMSPILFGYVLWQDETMESECCRRYIIDDGFWKKVGEERKRDDR